MIYSFSYSNKGEFILGTKHLLDLDPVICKGHELDRHRLIPLIVFSIWCALTKKIKKIATAFGAFLMILITLAVVAFVAITVTTGKFIFTSHKIIKLSPYL